jgi:hypothetical protein
MTYTYKFSSGFIPPSQRQFDQAMDEYELIEMHVGDNPNLIADRMGISRGSGCVIRRMCRERRG